MKNAKKSFFTNSCDIFIARGLLQGDKKRSFKAFLNYFCKFIIDNQ
jgi:hypothetical protein